MVELEVFIEGERKRFKFDPTTGRDELPQYKLIKERTEDLRPAFKEVHKILLGLSKSIFETQGREINAPWPDYTTAERRQYTPYKKAILGSEYPIMRWRGGNNPDRLYRSLTEASSTDHIWKASKENFEFGTRVPYAAGHHTGTGKGWRDAYTVPKRPLLGSNWRVVGEVLQEIQGYIFGSTGKYRPRGGIFG